MTSAGFALWSRIKLANTLKNLRGSKLILANSCLGYLAAAFSGVGNMVMMRSKEFKDGIKVQNKEGDVDYGTSRVAAR